MQIVIELNEEEFKDFVDNGKDIPLPHLFGALYHGIPLPMGHGRLIDESDIEYAKFRVESRYCEWEYDELVHWEDIQDAPTIIPADRVKENV